MFDSVNISFETIIQDSSLFTLYKTFLKIQVKSENFLLLTKKWLFLAIQEKVILHAL